MITIKDLKEAIKEMPDDLIVGATGWEGEYLEIDIVGIKDVIENYSVIADMHNKEQKTIRIFELYVEYAGDMPD